MLFHLTLYFKSKFKACRLLSLRTAEIIMLLILSCGVLVGGCKVTVKMPLCPRVATRSYPGNPSPGTFVNKYIAEQAQIRRVIVRPLSPFTTEISGSRRQIDWFKKNYPFMLCAFDPAQVIKDENVYLVCMGNAVEWSKIVQSNKPEDLMLQHTHFASACVP